MKAITINGWVGKWDKNASYKFSPITITAIASNIVLYHNKRGTALTVLTSGNRQVVYKGVGLMSRTIDQDGPMYGCTILGTRYELDLTKDEYDRVSALVTEALSEQDSKLNNLATSIGKLETGIKESSDKLCTKLEELIDKVGELEGTTSRCADGIDALSDPAKTIAENSVSSGEKP